MPSQHSADTQPRRSAADFVGREETLALAIRRWHEADEGSGQFVLVAGEAGIGKTRLLGEIGRRIPGARQLSASVFPRDVEAVGSLILELCDALDRDGRAEAAIALRNRLAGSSSPGGDPSRARRMLVSDLAGLLQALLDDEPTLLRIEDLHWADELSLDVLERVASTVRSSRSLVLATYRSEELYPRSPLRRLRARLLEQRLAEEVRLTRLDAGQTAELVRSIAASTALETVNAIIDRSDGIPLYVEELLLHGTTAVPDTIADAVAYQVALLAPATLPVLEAAAVIGRSFDVDLLAAIADTSTADVDEALGNLAERNLVLPGGNPAVLDFRHALIRDAVYQGIPPLRKRDLHAAVARAAAAAGFSDAYLSDQYEQARMPAEAFRHALTAGREAHAISSNREAVGLLRRAQRTTPNDVTQAERALIYAELAEVLSATDDNEAAAEQLSMAIELYRSCGNELAAALLVPSLASARHLLGADYSSRAQLIDEELRRIDALEPPAPAEVRAALLAALAAAYMLDRCLDDAMEAGTEAAALARLGNAVSEQIDIDLTLGSVLVFAGPGTEGWPILESGIARARALRFEAQAARGFRMIGSSASVLVEYPRASKWIADGLDYTRSAERWNDYHYLEAHAAHVEWATGNWTSAESRATQALADGRGGITTRSTALIVLGYVALGRDDLEAASTHLEEAREIGEQMRELQRLVPALWGLAESALLSGDPAMAVEVAEYAYSKSEPIGDAAYIFPFLMTGVRAYVASRDLAAARSWFDRTSYLLRYRGIPGTLPAIPHAEGLVLLGEGQTGAARTLLEDAADGWLRLGRYWERARATVDLAHCAARSRRPRDAARLVADVRETSSRTGASSLDRLASEVAGDDESLGPLSARELEVARLVATGSTNREIAETLTISPKTASSHIEHILAKLGVSRRSEIAAWVSRSVG